MGVRTKVRFSCCFITFLRIVENRSCEIFDFSNNFDIIPWTLWALPMIDFGLLRTFARELTNRQLQPRGKNPSTSLSPAIVREALCRGGSVDGRYAAGYLYHTARISQTIFGSKVCLDLGAAPGCQLIQVAALHSDTHFIGIDISSELLECAETQTDKSGLSNIEWLKEDIRSLDKIDSHSVDAVISTMTLHDLPNINAVRHCLKSIERVLRPGGAIYIEDYARLKSPKSVAYFNKVNGDDYEDSFSALNACSLSAAFDIKELRSAFLECLPNAQLYSTFIVPFLNVASTPARQLPESLIRYLQEMRMSLNPEKRANLDDLRKFFRLGGWRNDPFG